MRRNPEGMPNIPHSAHSVDGRADWSDIRRRFLGMYPACQVCSEERAELVQHFPRTREQLIGNGIPHPDAPVHLRGICAFCYFTA